MIRNVMTKGGPTLLYDIRDALDIVREYVGDELRDYLEEYLADVEGDRDASEAAYAEEVSKTAAKYDHETSLLSEIEGRMESIMDMINEPRLSKKGKVDIFNHAEDVLEICRRER